MTTPEGPVEQNDQTRPEKPVDDLQQFTHDVTAAEIETATTALNAIYEHSVVARQLTPSLDMSPETLYLP
jgi:hypothetical protein